MFRMNKKHKKVVDEKVKAYRQQEHKKFMRMLGARFKNFRMRANHGKGYTQEQAYNLLGLDSMRSLINYENGISEPSVGTLINMARIYGVSMDQLCANFYEGDVDLLAPTQEELEQAEYEADRLEWAANVMRQEGFNPLIRRSVPSLRKSTKPAHHLVTTKKKK